MAFITLGEARRRGMTPPQTTSARVLKEEAGTLRKSAARYDIFLSHSFSDATLVLGVKRILEEDGGLRVFVDWVEYPELDRSRVTAETAAIIRAAMENSNSMIFTTSETSPSSKWMPWELGFFDGKRGSDKVAVLPLVETEGKEFKGQEYLALYGQVERHDLRLTKSDGSSRQLPRALAVVSSPRSARESYTLVPMFASRG
ncbi:MULTISPECIES: TIR domain-containing protein [Roseomonadaceae]|uniref:Toll/interleukin-1 receptor domain-containing protein n=1 Tax=Falsiroseomonas oleicola TaxID=2801474 RepID=A0ABS6HBN4_9PROT|nr:TIR domain-containing protein [Roseomonas oleicola]MBU8546129.1 toll/interleukin-1 receptor domain-containing protein [Roseomonas oleicola]